MSLSELSTLKYLKSLVSEGRVDRILSNFKVNKVYHNSSSIVIFGDLNKTQVVIKLVFEPLDTIDNCLLVEQQIYSNVIENLINNFHTPHLISCIGVVNSMKNNSIIKRMISDDDKKFIKNLEGIDPKLYNIKKPSFLILEKSNGKTLGEYLIDENLDTKHKFSILFQLFYTLLCFEKIRFTHNDLHGSNIFIEKLEVSEEQTYYISDDKWVRISIHYKVKIYDFDRGSIYHPSVDKNNSLEFFKHVDQSPIFSSRRDLSSIFGLFILRAKDTKSFTTKCISPKFFKRVYDRPFPHLNTYFPMDAMGNELSDDPQDLKPDPEIDNTQLKSISECINVLLKEENFKHESGIGKLQEICYTLPKSSCD